MKIKGNVSRVSQYIIFLEIVAAVYWCTFLLKSDSYYVPYLFVGIAGWICFLGNSQRNIEFFSGTEKTMTRCYGAAFSLMVTLANYNIFLNAQMPVEYAGGLFGKLYKIGSAIIVLVGGYFIFTQILIFLYSWIKGAKEKKINIPRPTYKIKDWHVFAFAWVAIATFNLLVLFGTMYPGVLSPDSIWQIEQLLSKSYSNHHPYYHTQLIHVMISLGVRIFGNLNAAVAVYSVFSICAMAFCFAYVVYTIFQMKHSLKLAVGIFIWYLIMPFHIMYSFTMWKDVLFGAAVTFFVVNIYRILRKIGNHLWLDYIMMLCAAMGMCLLRSNGWFTFVLSTLVFGVLLGKEQKKLVWMFGSVIMVSFILQHPVLDALDVAPTGRMESLSIPAQQIARVIADGKEITSGQEELLSKVLDINEIPKTYKNYISDPIKILVNAKGNQDYISENKLAFIKLYLQIGITYPQKYLEAWVDQTRGYWNAGYSYWKWQFGVYDNSLGIKSDDGVGAGNKILHEYLWAFENVPILQIFVCIGFYVWLIILSTYVTLVKKDYIAFFISVPNLMLVLSLLVATPVFAEFRYAYAIFCSMPFILLVSFSNCASGRKTTAG